MRTHAETASLINEVKYPGLSFELKWQDRHALPGVDFTPSLWDREMNDLREKDRVVDAHLRVVCKDGTCNVTGRPHSWNGRWWRLSQHMTDSEIVWTAFKAVLTALEHEAREKFTFKGIRVADSHVDIHKLADFMAQPSVHDSRA